MVLAAARYLGVAPWALAEAPAIWMAWALAAMGAEADARTQQGQGTGQ